MKRILILIFVALSAVIFISCKDNSPTAPADIQLSKGPGGGGHTEVVGNNLSFPALLADGYTITKVDTQFTVPYTGPYTGLTAEELAYLQANGPWYAQKVEGNKWQADFLSVSSVDVTFIDWGDAIESVDPKVGRPYRIELGLYSGLSAPMKGYTMALLAFPSSLNESQGTNKLTYDSYYASVASPKGSIVIQQFAEDSTLTWNGSSWDGAYPPINVIVMQEMNVGGKLIYGASQGGWKPTQIGSYRITFYFKAGTTVNLSNAIIADFGDPTIPKVAENNQPYVDASGNNISYVDVQVTAGGGKGGR